MDGTADHRQTGIFGICPPVIHSNRYSSWWVVWSTVRWIAPVVRIAPRDAQFVSNSAQLYTYNGAADGLRRLNTK